MKQSFRIVFASVFLTLLLSSVLVYADWTAPGFSAPTCPSGTEACNTPINVSLTGQRKTGWLGAFSVFVGNAPDAIEQNYTDALRTTGTAIINDGGYPLGLIVAAGNVGIGTVAPEEKLHIVGDRVIIEDTSAEILFKDTLHDDWLIGTVGPTDSFRFISNNGTATRLSLLSNGNVGVGDTTPASLLTVGDGDLFQINSDGNVGIGVSPSASYKLQVAGGVTRTTGGLILETRSTAGQCDPSSPQVGQVWMVTGACAP